MKMKCGLKENFVIFLLLILLLYYLHKMVKALLFGVIGAHQQHPAVLRFSIGVALASGVNHVRKIMTFV